MPTCAVVGVHPVITNTIASIEVSEATRIILGKKPRLANKLLHCDIWHMEFEEVEIIKTEDCPVCDSKPSSPRMPLRQRPVTELCARGGKRTFVITPRGNLALDLDELYSLLVTNGVEAKVKADLGITFDSGQKRTASMLKSGIMIIESAADEEEAYNFYRQTIIDELRISRSSIE